MSSSPILQRYMSYAAEVESLNIVRVNISPQKVPYCSKFISVFPPYLITFL